MANVSKVGMLKMDILTALPEEISEMILKMLPPEDKARCLFVCKGWRELVNYDRLWKPHCDSFDITSDKSELIKLKREKSDICLLARAWTRFRSSPAWACLVKKWQTKKLKHTKHYCHTVCHNNILVACRGASKIIAIYCVQNSRIRHYRLSIPFSVLEWDDNIAVNDKYLVISLRNVTIAYKKYEDDKKFEYRMHICVVINKSNVIKTRNNFDEFLKKYLKHTDNYTTVCGIIGDYVWLQKIYYNLLTFVVNLDSVNGKVTKINTIDSYDSLQVVGFNLMSSLSETGNSVQLFFKSGRRVCHLEHGAEEIRANKRIFVTFYVKVDCQIMETWLMASARRILIKKQPKYAYYEIHPKYDILFQYELRTEYVVGMCALTGERLWHIHIPFYVDFTYWYFRILCGRYLYLYQTRPTSLAPQPYCVMDTVTHKLVRKGYRPPGEVAHVSENLIVTRTVNDKLYIKYC